MAKTLCKTRRGRKGEIRIVIILVLGTPQQNLVIPELLSKTAARTLINRIRPLSISCREYYPPSKASQNASSSRDAPTSAGDDFADIRKQEK